MASILITGKGGSGSWKIRGEQLGEAIGATVKPNATASDVKAHDVVVVVKKLPDQSVLRHAKRVVWDIVDAWPQPTGNSWDEWQAKRWLNDTFRTDCVFATQKMQADSESNGLFLRHHYRPGIAENPIRQAVKKIGYEGSERYLSNWRPVIEAECAARGWRFVVNPAELADLDIVLAVRGGEFDGYATRNWKSCVKLSNAVGSLTPIICLPESGYKEVAPLGVVWADKPEWLANCFDFLASHAERLRVAESFARHRDWFSLGTVSREYSRWLQELRF